VIWFGYRVPRKNSEEIIYFLHCFEKRWKKVKNIKEIIYFLHCFLFSSSFLTFYNLYLLFFTVFRCKKAFKKTKRFGIWPLVQEKRVITSDINYGTQCRQNCNMTSLNKICLALLCVFQPSCHVVLDRPACKSQASSSSLHLLASNARNFSINVAATATAAHTTPAVTSKVKLAALLLTRGEMGCLRFKFKLHFSRWIFDQVLRMYYTVQPGVP
jgi:hypothetical protein